MRGHGAARRDRRHARVAATLLGVGVALAVVGPFPVTAGIARMAGWTLLVAGASIVVGRTGAVDLSTAAVVAVGAYTGAVALPLAGLPAPFGLVLGALVGGGVGAATGALAGRVGGLLVALPTLSVTVAVVAVLRSVGTWGGAAGHHAAPFLTGGEVGDSVAIVVLAAAGVVAATWWWGRRGAARAAVGAATPAVLAALGHHPARATAVAGAVGGVLLGAGGAAQVFAAGSVSPDAHGLALAASLALAATIGGAPPLGPVVGAAWLWGPAILFPLAPVVGDAPPLLTTGLAGLALLAVRRGRPLVPSPTSVAAGPARRGAPDRASGSPGHDAVLEVEAGPGHDGLLVRAGEVVAVVGPNGAGKSTLLARIGGQLPDRGTVRLHGAPAPAGAVARARIGLARTWQRPPDVSAEDLLAAAGWDRTTPAALAELPGTVSDPSSDAGAQLVAALATGPDVVLLDEPALAETEVVAMARALAGAGLAVVLVDHRSAVVEAAARTCVVDGDGEGRR